MNDGAGVRAERLLERALLILGAAMIVAAVPLFAWLLSV